MTPRPSQRDAIVCAALACFARDGYDATRIKHIAQAAGVSEGAIYRHFASKEELARELHLQVLATFSEVLASSIEGADLPLAQLERMARRTLDGYRETPDQFAFALLHAPRTSTADVPPGCELPVDVLANVLQRGQADGSIRSGDPRVLASAFLGCLVQPIAMSRSMPGCLPDLFASDASDEALVSAALGSVAAA